MLMVGYYKQWYRKLCCCCISSCVICCFCDKEQQKMYQEHIDKSRVNTKSKTSYADTTDDGNSGVTNKKDSRFTADTGTPVGVGSKTQSLVFLWSDWIVLVVFFTL